MTSDDYYRTLGVSRGASIAEIRAAYLDKARLYHPDRQVGAGSAEVRSTDDAMKAINEAWRMLSDPSLRADHDSAIARASHAYEPTEDNEPFRSPGDNHEPDGFMVTERTAFILRFAPWLLLAVVGFGLLVVTAYATRSDDGVPSVSDCIRIDEPGYDVVGCGSPNDGRIVSITTGECGPDAQPFRPNSIDETLCLVEAG